MSLEFSTYWALTLQVVEMEDDTRLASKSKVLATGSFNAEFPTVRNRGLESFITSLFCSMDGVLDTSL